MATRKVSHPGPSVQGLVRYLWKSSPTSLGNFQFRRLGEESNFRQELRAVLYEIAMHGHEQGRISLTKHRADDLLEQMALARAQVILAEWVRECQNTLPDASTQKKRLVGVEKVLAQAEEDSSATVKSYADQHTSLLYYEKHGCISCHQMNGPHHASGFCYACYMLVLQRRRSILEGRKRHILKPPARFGVVPSPLGRGAKLLPDPSQKAGAK